MCNVSITYNSAKNGIELHFSDKPEASVLDMLKANGFRWSVKQKMWYAHQNEKTVAVAGSLVADSVSGQIIKEASPAPEEREPYDLWAMTRTDGIGCNVDKALTAKEIASICRQHIKTRFPMCRISFTVQHGDDFCIDIKAAPFANKSEELEAIVKYIDAYVKSYKYGDSDPYADYCWHNFYGGRCDTWGLTQTEQTGEVKAMIERFQASKTAFEAAEEERMAREQEESRVRYEAELAESRRLAAIREMNRKKVEAGAVVRNVEYFVENAVIPAFRKLDSVEEYNESIKENGLEKDDLENGGRACRVTKEVHLTGELYDLFSRQLLDDWDFVAGMGGTATDDYRVSSNLDWQMMSEEERETVEWYYNDCAAIFADGVMKLIVNPEGYSYCRYTYLVGENTRAVNSHVCRQVMAEEEHEKAVEAAEIIEDISTQVIETNGLIASWRTDNFDIYKEAMKRKIYGEEGKPPIRFSLDAVRAIRNDMPELKEAMYTLLNELNGAQEQFSRANLQPGQRITVVRIASFGGLEVMRYTLNNWKKTKYAQYDDAVELDVTLSRARHRRKIWLYNDFLVYDGWLGDLPESLVWETVSEKEGVVMRAMRRGSFDHGWYADAIAHYRNCGRAPMINTYQPPFGKDSKN